jgi:aconitate hydratase
MSIYDAAMRYRGESVRGVVPQGAVPGESVPGETVRPRSAPLVVFAGKEYGTGSSRDWAAKGPLLLGVRAVIAESFERIHRGNLVGMGVLPLELPHGVMVASLSLDGSETVDVEGIAGGLAPGATVTLVVRRGKGEVGAGEVRLSCRARIDSTLDAEYFAHGGVLPRVLRLKLGEPSEGGGYA